MLLGRHARRLGDRAAPAPAETVDELVDPAAAERGGGRAAEESGVV